jgi:hypothetical protein
MHLTERRWAEAGTPAFAKRSLLINEKSPHEIRAGFSIVYDSQGLDFRSESPALEFRR